jgi:predicted 3-demethylubiquinone-9 3-methyltransferase (glyoxalase superfamily)
VNPGGNALQKITPFLWFDGRAEEAANFYTAIFSDARILDVMRYGEAGPGPKGAIMSATFELQGQTFIALNGGSIYKFSPAVSFFVTCETQDEVDHFWSKLSDGGQTLQCGWLTDKFGVTWQVVPAVLLPMLSDPDAGKSKRVMEAMMRMIKLDIALLTQAYEQS